MHALPETLTLKSAENLDDVPLRTFYAIARLRQEVFVCEQGCVYLDLDGRDLEAGTLQFWVETDEGEVVATLRVLNERTLEAGLSSIGRVVAARAWRGRGVAAALMQAAVDRFGDGPLTLQAQSHLTGWHQAFGFEPCGDEYVEDGIPHTPMRRDPESAS